jgi:hypothetical protein
MNDNGDVAFNQRIAEKPVFDFSPEGAHFSKSLVADDGEEVDVGGAPRPAVLEPGALGETSEQDELQKAVASCACLAVRPDAGLQFLKDDLLDPGKLCLLGRGEMIEGCLQLGGPSGIWKR